MTRTPRGPVSLSLAPFALVTLVRGVRRAALLVGVGLLVLSGPAQAKKCHKGKVPCGNKCIAASADCPSAPAAQPAPPLGGKPLESASSTAVSVALASQAGRAMVALAKTLRQTGDLDVDDKQRAAFRQALRGARPPLAICAISHIQLVRDCDPLVGGNVTLPCYLAVDEMAAACKTLGQEMPQFK